jgi:hypothetical protein
MREIVLSDKRLVLVVRSVKKDHATLLLGLLFITNIILFLFSLRPFFLPSLLASILRSSLALNLSNTSINYEVLANCVLLIERCSWTCTAI